MSSRFVGGRILLEKLQQYRPKIAVFNGKGIYEVFSGKKEFTFGKQPECIDGTNTVSLLAQPWKKRRTRTFPFSFIRLYTLPSLSAYPRCHFYNKTQKKKKKVLTRSNSSLVAKSIVCAVH